MFKARALSLQYGYEYGSISQYLMCSMKLPAPNFSICWFGQQGHWVGQRVESRPSNGIVRRRMVCWPLKGLLSVYMCNVGRADSREYLSITEMALGKVVGTLSNGRKQLGQSAINTAACQFQALKQILQFSDIFVWCILYKRLFWFKFWRRWRRKWPFSQNLFCLSPPYFSFPPFLFFQNAVGKSLHRHPDNQLQQYSKSSPSSSSSCLECPKSCVTKLMVSLLPTPRTSYRSFQTHITIILFIINVFILIGIFILRAIVNLNRTIIIICVAIVILE